MSAEQIRQIKEAIELLTSPLTPKESQLVKGYEADSLGYPTNLCLEDKNSYEVRNFATPSDNTKQFLKEGDFVSYGCYHSVDNVDEYISADALLFCQKYMISLLPSEMKEGVHFGNCLTTSCWNSKKNNKYREGGTGFATKTTQNDRDYNNFFGRGNTFNQFKRVYFPFHINNNHYVGAVANNSKVTVATFDSFGIKETSHQKVFKWLSSMLNFALKRDGEEPKQWKHEIVDVPKQQDGVNCGLFRTVNGVILSLFDDPHSNTVKELLLTQEQIQSVRAKLAGLILHLSTLRSPEELKDRFAAVKVCLDDGSLQLERAKRAAEAKKNPHTKDEIISIDVVEDEVNKKPAAKGKIPAAKPSKDKSKKKEPSQFQFPKSVTFSDDVKATRLEEVKMKCKHAHMFESISRQFPSDQNIRKCFNFSRRNSGSGDEDFAKFKDSFSQFCTMFNIHCQQVLCLLDFSTHVWPKFGKTADEDAFRTVFARYLLDTLVLILRASTILSNGRALVKADVAPSATYHFVDLILQKDKQSALSLKYKSMNCTNARTWKEESWDSVAGWTAKMHDTFQHIEDLLRDVKTKFCTHSVKKGVLVVSFDTNN